MQIKKSDIKVLVPRFDINTPDVIVNAHIQNVKRYKLSEVFDQNLIKNIDAISYSTFDNAVDYLINQYCIFNGIVYKANIAIAHGGGAPDQNSNWAIKQLPNFWETYIKPYFIWEFYAEFFSQHGVTVSDSGAYNLVSDNHQAISKGDRHFIVDDAKSKANYERQLMMNYFYEQGLKLDNVQYLKVQITAKPYTNGVISIPSHNNPKQF